MYCKGKLFIPVADLVQILMHYDYVVDNTPMAGYVTIKP